MTQMKARTPFTLFLLCALTLTGCTLQYVAGLNGTVTNASNGHPLEGLTVDIWRCNDNPTAENVQCDSYLSSTVTGKKGLYSLPDLETGFYQVDITWEPGINCGFNALQVPEWADSFHLVYVKDEETGNHSIYASSIIDYKQGQKGVADLAIPCPGL